MVNLIWTGFVAALPEMRDKEAAALVEAPTPVVAAWLWRKFAANTKLAAIKFKSARVAPSFRWNSADANPGLMDLNPVGIRGARASRVRVRASRPNDAMNIPIFILVGRGFRRDAENGTPEACAPQRQKNAAPTAAGEWGGAGGYKDFAPDGAANRRAEQPQRGWIFSPALTDAVGLRWVNG